MEKFKPRRLYITFVQDEGTDQQDIGTTQYTEEIFDQLQLQKGVSQIKVHYTIPTTPKEREVMQAISLYFRSMPKLGHADCVKHQLSDSAYLGVLGSLSRKGIIKWCQHCKGNWGLISESDNWWRAEAGHRQY